MVELLPYTWASLEWMLVTMMPGAGYWIIRISRGLQELLRPAQGSNEGKHGKHLLIKSHKITPNLCQSSPKYLTNQTGLARKSPHLIEWLPIKTSIKCDLPYMFMIFLLFTRWVPSQPLLRLITDSTDPYIILYTCILQGVQNFSPYLKNRPWSIGVGNFSQGLICVFLQIWLVSHSFPIMLLPNFCYLAQLEHLLCMLQALVLAARLRVSLAAITAVKLRLGDWRWWQVNNSNIRFHMKI